MVVWLPPSLADLIEKTVEEEEEEEEEEDEIDYDELLLGGDVISWLC